MDRNVVIATVLIALIMVVWMTMLTPDQTVVQEQFRAQDDSTEQVEIPEPVFEQPSVVPGQVPVFASGDSTVIGSQEGEVRDIVVDTELYEARFSTKGATLTSFILKEYSKFESEELVQMVDTSKGGAIGMVFMSPGNRIYDTRSFTFDSRAPRHLTVGDVPSEISFRAAVGSGSITKRYSFDPDTYEIRLSIELESPETFITHGDYEVVWNGGIPFTEGDHKNETTRSGAFARSGGEVESVMLASEAYDETSLRGVVDWVAVKNKYFVSAIIPDVVARGAELIAERFGELDDPDVRLDFVAGLEIPIVDAAPDNFRIYLGPMEFKHVNAYGVGLYDMVDYGWDFLETITKPLAKYIFIPVFGLLYGAIGNYGLVIIIFSILIKLLLYPLTKKSFKSMAKMKELQPRMQAIKEKYADNPKKQQEATMKMYKETGVNPLGGCMPMLLQYPIIIALWQFLPQAIELRQKHFLWADDLSAPDIILNLPFDIPMLGNFIAGFTLLMGISMVVQMKIQAMPGSGMQQKMFTYIMPVFIVVIFNRLASGLNLYYLCYNVLTAVQQKFINRQLHEQTEEQEEKGGASHRQQTKSKEPGKRQRKTIASNGRAKARPAKKSRR